MEDLAIVQEQGKLLVDSRQVAKMIGKEHWHLLRSIRGYTKIINESNSGLVEKPKFDSRDFFIEDTYTDGKGEKRIYYLVTKKGCDMVANKLTGEKGVLFTAAYVTKFDEMEAQLTLKASDIIPLDQMPRATLTILDTYDSLADSIENRVSLDVMLEAMQRGLSPMPYEDLEQLKEQTVQEEIGVKPKLGEVISLKLFRYYQAGPKPLAAEWPLEAPYPDVPELQINLQVLEASMQIHQLTA